MNEFHFLRPWWLIALIPSVLLLWRLWLGRADGSAWRKVIAPHLLEKLWLESPGKVSKLPLLLLGVGWLLAILVLAGPVWEKLPEPVWKTQASRILILDLSPSMAAADPAPSRLERARYKILDILRKNREGKTGLVIFAAQPHLVSPLTDDGDTIKNLLSALSVDIVPAPGDAGAPALKLGGELLQQAGAREGDLLLLTDGISDPAAAMRMARDLNKQGYRLSVLAVGSAQGAPLPGSGGSVMVRLDAAPLRELARTGGGGFSLMSADDSDLSRVLPDSSRSSPAEKQDDSGVERWVEYGVWLLPLLALLGSAGFRRGWLAGVFALLILPPPADAFEWRDLWLRKDQQAAQALHRGQADQAAKQFDDAGWRGMALYQSGKFDEAAQAFADSQDPTANYNRGNALAKAGQLKQAAEAYRDVLEKTPDHVDAKANLELVENLLKQQEQQQQQNNQQNSPSDQNQQDEGQQQEQQQDQGQQGEEQQSKEQTGQQGEEEQSKDQKGEQGEEKDKKEQPSSDPQQAQQSKQSDQQQKDSQEAARKDVQDSGDKQTEQQDERQQAKELAEQDKKSDDKKELAEKGFMKQKPKDEKEIAMEQWLRQIPDDPGGLLRRKFQLEYDQRMRQRNSR